MALTVYFILLACSIIFQLTIVPLLAVQGVTPDLILLLVLGLTLQRGRMWGIPVAFLAGLLYDVFGTGLIGVSSLANVVAVFIIGFLQQEQLEQRLVIVLAVFFLAVYVHDALYFLILFIGTSASTAAILFKHSLFHTLYSMVFLTIIQLFSPGLLWGRRHSFR